MKKTLLSLLILVYIALFALSAFAEMKNESDNFRGIPWGAPAPEKKLFGGNQWGLDERYMGEYGSKKVYLRRKDDNLSLGDAEVRHIYYSFQESLGFAHVEITFYDRENLDLVRKTCMQSWGNPDTDIRDVDKQHGIDHRHIFWRGKKVTAHVLYSNNINIGILEIYLNNYYEKVWEANEKILQKERGL